MFKKDKKNLSTFEYKTWIKPIHVEQNSNLFTIYCNNEYFKKHIKSKYGNLILATIQECYGSNDLNIEYSNKKFSGEKITEVITAGPQANFFSTSSVEIKDESEEAKVVQESKTSKNLLLKTFLHHKSYLVLMKLC